MVYLRAGGKSVQLPCATSAAMQMLSPNVIWAITTRVDPTRDTLLADSPPIDYLDFASPVSGLGSKMGLDATHKWPGETSREWGRPLQMNVEVTAKVQQVWRPWVCKSNWALDPVHAA